MKPTDRINQVRGSARSPHEAIVMLLCASADQGGSNGLTLSNAAFDKAADLILMYYGHTEEQLEIDRAQRQQELAETVAGVVAAMRLDSAEKESQQ